MKGNVVERNNDGESLGGPLKGGLNSLEKKGLPKKMAEKGRPEVEGAWERCM